VRRIGVGRDQPSSCVVQAPANAAEARAEAAAVRVAAARS